MKFFKSLTVGIKFDKNKCKRENLKKDIKLEEIKKINDEPRRKRKMSMEYQKHQQNEKINSIRKENHINVKGDMDKEKPIESFEELFTKFSINETLKKNLLKLNYEKPSPVQMQVIPLILQNKQVKVCSPTGSGKIIISVSNTFNFVYKVSFF